MEFRFKPIGVILIFPLFFDSLLSNSKAVVSDGRNMPEMPF